MPSLDQYDTGTDRESMGRIMGRALQMSEHGGFRSATKAGTRLMILNNEPRYNPR